VSERLPLADLLALAILDHGPSPGSRLALKVQARKAAVLAELRRNPRFEQIGRGRGSRWRLALGAWEPLGTDPRAEAREDVRPDVDERLADLECRVAELERRVAEVPTR
jgi:hypothetical protein